VPLAAARPCRHAGCDSLVRDGSGYCEKHQVDKHSGKFADARRGTRQERGYGAEWEQTRKRILRRDCGLCQVCLARGQYRRARQVDHKVPKFEGGTGEDSNLQSICVACHKGKTAQEAARARMGWGH